MSINCQYTYLPEEDALDIERLSINCRISLKIFKIKSCVKDPSVESQTSLINLDYFMECVRVHYGN